MRNNIIIEKLLGYIDKIQKYCNGLDYEKFTSNDIVVEACVFNLSQIGELANKIDTEFEKAHSNIPWKQLYGLRNRIVHDYEGVNLKLVWEIIGSDLEELKQTLESLLND